MPTKVIINTFRGQERIGHVEATVTNRPGHVARLDFAPNDRSIAPPSEVVADSLIPRLPFVDKRTRICLDGTRDVITRKLF